MKKTPLISLKFFLAGILTLIVFTNCGKNALTNDLSSTALNSAVKPDYLPGSCPYPCTDVRCKAYLNGYCGGGSDTIAIIKNTNNPYDNVGQQHNNGLNVIWARLNKASSNLDSATLVLDESYVTSLGYSSSSMQSFYNTAVQDGYLPFSQIQELDSLGNLLHKNGVISSTANSYVQQIYTYASTYLNTTSGNAPSQANYTSFANSLITLEGQISSNGSLSSTEKSTLLSCAAIGRYSASYWANYINKNGNSDVLLANKIVVVPDLKFLTWLHNLGGWWKIGIADIGGGLVGIIGGPVGIIGGAVGTSIVTAVAL